jgi:hypothetical protein
MAPNVAGTVSLKNSEVNNLDKEIDETRQVAKNLELTPLLRNQ